MELVMEFIYRFPPDTSRFELSNRSRRISLPREEYELD
jgi:hypothetical protein